MLKNISYVEERTGERPSLDDQWYPDADLDRVEQISRFDGRFDAHPASIEEITPRSRIATYHVAYACAEGDRVAVMVANVHDGLSGFGTVVVLQRVDGTWRFVSARQIWEA